MKTERPCRNCPAFYKCERDGISATGGGYHDVKIDGKKVTICRPGTRLGAKRTMEKYSFYCLACATGKKIATMASWTGRTPKWCPLGREMDMKEPLKPGDKVRMNDHYHVSEENQGKIWTVASDPWTVCSTMVVKLEGRPGSYAVDGLDLVEG